MSTRLTENSNPTKRVGYWHASGRSLSLEFTYEQLDNLNEKERINKVLRKAAFIQNKDVDEVWVQLHETPGRCYWLKENQEFWEDADLDPRHTQTHTDFTGNWLLAAHRSHKHTTDVWGLQSYTAPCRYSARNLLNASGLYPARPAGICGDTKQPIRTITFSLWLLPPHSQKEACAIRL